MVAIRLPLQDNRIVAWKFCHVTHKLLREGHPACLDDSQRHINMIENLGKLWVSCLRVCGECECRVLVMWKFHRVSCDSHPSNTTHGSPIAVCYATFPDIYHEIFKLTES